MPAEQLVQMNTRIPASLKEKLEVSAKRAKRTLNAEVIALLEEALDANEKKIELPPNMQQHLDVLRRIFEEQARELVKEAIHKKTG